MIDRFDGTKHAFLSNFYLAPIEYEGLTYPSSEHAYQAAKTEKPLLRKLFIQSSVTAAKSKKMGRQLDLRENWDIIKRDIMEEIVRIKFQTHKKLAEKLRATGEEQLIEGNTWHDVFFGVCRCSKHGYGENHLGRILMKVRAELWREALKDIYMSPEAVEDIKNWDKDNGY